MKIRIGFVSNSSSSSFIIRTIESKPCPHCGRKDGDIIDSIEESNNEETNVRARGRDDVIKEWKDYYGGHKDKVKKKLEALSKTEEVYFVEISYHDETINSMFDDSKNIEIIYRGD